LHRSAAEEGEPCRGTSVLGISEGRIQLAVCKSSALTLTAKSVKRAKIQGARYRPVRSYYTCSALRRGWGPCQRTSVRGTSAGHVQLAVCESPALTLTAKAVKRAKIRAAIGLHVERNFRRKRRLAGLRPGLGPQRGRLRIALRVLRVNITL